MAHLRDEDTLSKLDLSKVSDKASERLNQPNMDLITEGGANLKLTDISNLGKIQTKSITDARVTTVKIADLNVTVDKITPGTARQLLQTNAGGAAAEWASNIDVPGTLDVTGAVTLDSTFAAKATATMRAIAVETDSTYDIGTASVRFATIYADTFDGDTEFAMSRSFLLMGG